MIGANVSAVGGLPNAFKETRLWEIPSCQFYVKPSRSWAGTMVGEEIIKEFKKERQNSPIKSVLAHSALIHNLSSETEIRQKSVSAVRLELNICSALGIEQLVVHCGYGQLDNLSRSLSEILEGYTGSAKLLLEGSAGQKGSRGSTINELLTTVSKFNSPRLGICLDTCHLFAAGYDVRNAKQLSEITSQTEKFLGAIHLNDSKGKLGGHLDRHQHIGQGEIGLEGFRTILSQLSELKIPKILETPEPKEKTALNLNSLRALF